MVLQLLPASAKAFATRTKPNVVLNTRAETWLTQTLKRVNRQKRPLNSVAQHRACLEDMLSAEGAIWSLASIMLPRAPKAELLVDEEDPLAEALANYQLLPIEGYVVHIDMVSQHEVAFKLTQDTIDALVDYHRRVYCADAAAGYAYDWPEKERQLKKMQADFVQAVNRHVFRTHARALEGLEEEGVGELLEGRSAEVKAGIEHIFHPLLPPPPKIIDVIAPQHYMATQYWAAASAPPPPPQYVVAAPLQMAPPLQVQLLQQQPQQQQQQHQQVHYLARPVEPWRVLGSTPSPASTHAEPHTTAASSWPTLAYADTLVASPTPSYSQPYTTASQYTSMPAMAPLQQSLQSLQSMHSLPLPLPLPLPSQLVGQQCSTSVADSLYANPYWGYNDLMPQYPISI